MRTHLMVLFGGLVLLLAMLGNPAGAANGSYMLSDYGDVSTIAHAEAAYQKAAAEILAKGGGVLVIPATAPKDWEVVNDFQQARDDAPVLTVLDLRNGYQNLFVPSIGSPSPYGWASQRVTRVINQKNLEPCRFRA